MAEQPFTWLNVEQAAALLGVSSRRLYRMVDAGTVPCLRNPVRFEQHALIAWVNQQLTVCRPTT